MWSDTILKEKKQKDFFKSDLLNIIIGAFSSLLVSDEIYNIALIKFDSLTTHSGQLITTTTTIAYVVCLWLFAFGDTLLHPTLSDCTIVIKI